MIKVSLERVIIERVTFLFLNLPEPRLKFLIWRVNRWRFQIFGVILYLEFFLSQPFWPILCPTCPPATLRSREKCLPKKLPLESLSVPFPTSCFHSIHRIHKGRGCWLKDRIFGLFFLDKRIGNAIALFHMTTVLIWLTKGLITWLVDWLIDWLPDSLINKLTDWLSNWLTDWLTQCLIHWLADCLTEFLTDSLIEWLTYCLTYWLKDQLANWMTHWLTNRLPDDWPTGKLAHSLTV